MAEPGNESSVLDFTGQGIRRVEPIPNAWPTTLIYDRNAISKIENLDQYKDTLQQLSFGENQLTRMTGVARLTSLTMLNLPHNSITSIDGLKNLTRLTWLNLSGNCLKSAENLQYSVNLQHLDLSDNSLTALPDVAALKHLKSLLLHGNLIKSLQTAPTHLTASLSVLSLAENDLEDLNEVAYLSMLPTLEQLSIMNNPCVIMTGPNPGFDYRPFVVNWCLTLGFLDGYQVKEKERLKAEWLYSQGKGRHYRPGQHFAVVQYLATVCPLTAAAELESMEDQKLARILQHQRLHQASLEEDTRPGQGQGRRPHTPSRGESPKLLQKESPKPGTSGGRRSSHEDSPVRGSQLTSEDMTSQPAMYSSPFKAQPVKAWAQGDAGRSPSSVSRESRLTGHPAADLQVQDITSSDDSPSMLESETRYIPLHTSELVMSPTKPLTSLTEGSGASPAPVRPVTAPPSSDPHHSGAALPYDDSERPASDMDVMPDRAEYLRHGGAGAAGGGNPARRMAANFPPSSPKGGLSGQVRPAHSELNPQSHSAVRKRSVSPLARGQEFVTTDSDSESLASEGSATLQLQLLKAILHNRKTKKSIRKSLHDASTHSSRDSQQRGPASVSRGYTEDGENWRTGVDAEVEQVMSRRDDRNHYDTERKLRHLAATRLQASWRGYLTRQRHPKAIKVRREIRSRRAEDHIGYLRNELERQRLLYEQEKQLRAVQLEAMKQLWRQVQTLQQWKQDVLQSQDLGGHVPPPQEEALNDSTKQLIDTLEKTSISTDEAGALPSSAAQAGVPPHSTASTRSPHISIPQPAPARSVDLPAAQTSQKEVELEFACKHLQQQVSHLQDVLTSVSNFVFQSNSGPGESVVGQALHDELRVSANAGHTDRRPNQRPAQPDKGPVVVPPGNSSQTAVRQGIPTAPGCLQATSHGPGTVFLNWNPSVILDSQGQPTSKPVLGYRVYVNDQAKGMVGGTKHQSLLEGLSPTQHYRVHLRGVSALGESADSNVVLVAPHTGDDIRLSQVADDNDGDGDSPDGHHQGRPGSDADQRKEFGGGGGGGHSSNPPDPGPTGKGPVPGTNSAQRDTTPSRIPTLRNRNLLHVQFDPADLESSKGSTNLDGTKGSCTTLEGSTKGSTLESDSGYLTTLGSLGHKQDSRLSTKASIAPSVAIETVAEEPNKRRATVLERLEQKLKTPKDITDAKQASPTSTQDNKNMMNKLLDNERLGIPSGSSPRIQEGLIKRLEQTREKGMRGELKYAAAKIHRRRIESPTPLKAIPSEVNRAEAIASDITSRRDQEVAGHRSRSGVVVEAPERLPKSKDSSLELGNTPPSKTKSESNRSLTADKKDDQSPSKSEVKLSPQPTSESKERRLSDSKLENVSDPLGERRKARSVYEEEKLKAYFSRHNSLRYRVQMTGRTRVRTNSGGEEQVEPEKDTPAVKMALQSYRENKHKSDDSPFEAESERAPAERKISPVSTQERRVSPVSTLEKRSPTERGSPTAAEKRSTVFPTPERRLSGSRLPSPSRPEVSPASAGSERRTLPETPPSEGSRTRDSVSSSSAGVKPERTPPAVPPRPSKCLKDSGLRARSPSPSGRAERAKDRCTSPSPMKGRSERSREASPAGTRSRSERVQEGSPGGESLSRRGSLRRRTPSTGSEAGGVDDQQRSGGSSPQKSSSDEVSYSSTSKYSSSESRSESRGSSRAPTQRGESPSAGRHPSPGGGGSGIPLPTDHGAGRPRGGAPPSPDRPTTSGTHPDDMVRHSRGRRSAREPRNNKKVEVGQRSSSVGAVVDRITGGCCNADTVIVTDKPPMAKRDGSRENLPGHKNSRENLHKGSRENVSSHKPPISRTSSKEDVSGRRSSGRRRTHSEQSAAGSSEDDDGSLPRSASRESFGERKSSSERSTGSGDMTEALQAALLAPAKTSPREKKPLLKHKRSNSDMSGIQALPDRPESPAPKDWKPSTPTKPNQAPSSPRVIRSSSFSKVHQGDHSQGSPDALLRQCISLETLKAAKSHDVGHFEAKARSSQNEAAGSHDSPPSTGITFDKAALVRRSLERCYGRNLNSSGGDGDKAEGSRGGRPHSMGHADELRSASDGAASARGAHQHHRYSDGGLQDYDMGHMEYDEDVMEVAKEMEKLHALPAQAIGDDRSSRMEELRERRTKLGSKAADLFAKLQQRLSASKT